MFAPGGSLWGPPPLPEFLTEQLRSRGFSANSAAQCASQINERPDPAVAASLFVDLGSCKFLEGDVDGAVAAWRHALASRHEGPGARALLNLGLLYEHVHLHERAIGVLRSVGQRGIDPYVSLAAMATARCQRSLGDLAAAMETLARLAEPALATESDSNARAEVFYGLGDIAAQAGLHDRAERAWRVAAVEPESAAQQAAADRLVTLLLEQGHDDHVLDLLSGHGLQINAAATTLLDHAQVLHQSGREAEARAVIAPLEGDALAIADRFRLADVRSQIGLINEAIDELEVLLGDPSLDVQGRAGFALGEIYRAYEMIEAAGTMYESVTEDGHRYWSPKAALAWGDLLQAQGKHDYAVDYWTQAAASQIDVVRSAATDRLTAPSMPTPLESHSSTGNPVANAGSGDDTVAGGDVAGEVVVGDLAGGDVAGEVAVDDLAVDDLAEGATLDTVAGGDVAAEVAVDTVAGGDVAAEVAVDDLAGGDVESGGVAVDTVAGGDVESGEVALDDLAVDDLAEGATLDDLAVDDLAEGATLDDLAVDDLAEGATLDDLAVDDLAEGATLDDLAVDDLAEGATRSIEIVSLDELERMADLDRQAEPVAAADDVEPSRNPGEIAPAEPEPVAAPTAIDLIDALSVDEVDAAGTTTQPLAEPAVAEPVVIALDDLGQDEEVLVEPGRSGEPPATTAPGAAAPDPTRSSVGDEPEADAVVINLDQVSEREESTPPAAFASLLGKLDGDQTVVPNPYAALAPDGEVSDVVPSTRNPYAELAPNFDDGDFEPGPDVEAGDWESMLDDWPRTEPQDRPKKPPKKRSRAFSRYT